MERHQVAGPGEIAARDRMADGGLDARPAPRTRRRRGSGARQARPGSCARAPPEDVAEHLVEAVPLAVPVEGDEEQVRALDLGEHRRGAVGLQHCVARGAGHLVEHGCAEQEEAHLLADRGEDVVRDVLEQVPGVAGEVEHEGVGILLVLQEDRRQARRPAAHPSVRSVRRATSSEARSAFALCRSEAASTCDSCRSVARTSLRSPCARHRPTGRFGSERLESTIWRSGGACSTSRRIDSSQTVLRTRCQSSTTRTDAGESESSSRSSGRTTLSTAAGPARSASSDVVPALGWTARSPAIRWLQNLTGSLSASSADSHTNGVRCPIGLVPLGEQRRLAVPRWGADERELPALPWRRRSRSWPRGVMPFRARGGASFERSGGSCALGCRFVARVRGRVAPSVLDYPSLIALSVCTALFHPG